MNKNGKMKFGGYLAITFVIAILIFAMVLFFTSPKAQNILVKETSAQSCGVPTGILTVNELNAIVGGTAPSSSTITAGINGGAVATSVTSGTTAFPVGSELTVLVSKSDYIDKSFTFTMPCGGYNLDAKLYQSTSDNPSVEIQDKNSNTISDNILGLTTNFTNVDVGGIMKGKVIFTGTALESSGEGIYVMEFPAGSDANITANGVTLGNLKEVTVPKVYTKLLAGSRVVAFEVPAVVGGQSEEYALSVQLEGSADLSGGVYTDWFNKQEFVNDDLTIGYGVQDSDGTAKYENTLDYDFYINSA